MRWFRQAEGFVRLGLWLVVVAGFVSVPRAAGAQDWVTAWTTAPLPEAASSGTPALAGGVLRQAVRVTVSGAAIRIGIGNYFGAEPLIIGGAGVHFAADAAGPGRAPQMLRFAGSEAVAVPPGGMVLSDPLALPVRAGATLVVSLQVDATPGTLTVHTAARSNSVLSRRDAGPGGPAQTFTRWYFLCGVDVLAPGARAVAVLGDSIADGYGCPPDSYARWPDVLARRLQADPAAAGIGVLNLGIGGNRLLRDGLGPRALDRLGRDVFGQRGVDTLIVALGINDIGTRLEARKKNEGYASAADIIGALRQIAEQARGRGWRVIGATITPYAGADFYWSEDGEADRQTVNAWIRESGTFDHVLDFDAVLRDPADPRRLAPAFDSGDHLHPSLAGYRALGESVPLAVLRRSR